MSFLTEDLVDAIKLSEFFPTNQATISDPDDFLAHANTELQTKLVPMLDKVKQGFFGAQKLVTLEEGLNHYAIPERSFMNTFRDLWWLQDSTKLYDKRPLPRVQSHNRDLYDQQSGTPVAYMIQGDEVILLPTPGANPGYILFDYKERPNKIISTSSCAKITNVTTGASTITFTVDTDLTGSLSSGDLIDLLCATSPFRLWNKDVAISSITATTIVIALADGQDEAGNTEPQVGDYICPAQETCIPMIPQEMHAILAEMVCKRILKSLGDFDAVAQCDKHIGEMMQLMVDETSQRAEENVDVIFDRHSILNLGNAARVLSGVN